MLTCYQKLPLNHRLGIDTSVLITLALEYPGAE